MSTYGKNAGLRSGNIINSIKAEVFKPLLFLHRQNLARRIVFVEKFGVIFEN